MQKVITYIKKVKPVNPLTLFKKWFLADITQTFAELNNSLNNKIDNLESGIDIDDIVSRVEDLEYYDLYDIQERAENAERIAEEVEDKINVLDDKVKTLTTDFVKPAKKAPAKKASQLEEERQLEKERSEQNLSDMQRLTFEICHYYGGEFDVDDFDNCYKIVNEYDVVWKRNPQPKKQGGQIR